MTELQKRQNQREASRKWRMNPENAETLREASRRWRRHHPSKSRSKALAQYRKNRRKGIDRSARWVALNPERCKENQTRWRANNRDKINAYKAARHRGDIENPQYVLSKRLRNSLNRALAAQGATKRASAMKLIGCSIDDLVSHLERQFQKGMSWASRSAIHIDHIRPLSSFDLTDPVQQEAAFHFTNLRPLWAIDNLRKGTKRIYLL